MANTRKIWFCEVLDKITLFFEIFSQPCGIKISNVMKLKTGTVMTYEYNVTTE